MPKVVLATGVEQLDRDLSDELVKHGVHVACECHYQEGILPCCKQLHADTVIVSPELPGSTGFEEIVGVLRRSPLNIRVILLPGPEDLVDSREMAMNLKSIAVYDIVFSTSSSAGSRVDVQSVVQRVLNPATLAEAEAMLKQSGFDQPLARTGVVDEAERSQKGGRFMKVLSTLTRRDGKDEQEDPGIPEDNDDGMGDEFQGLGSEEEEWTVPGEMESDKEELTWDSKEQDIDPESDVTEAPARLCGEETGEDGHAIPAGESRGEPDAAAEETETAGGEEEAGAEDIGGFSAPLRDDKNITEPDEGLTVGDWTIDEPVTNEKADHDVSGLDSSGEVAAKSAAEGDQISGASIEKEKKVRKKPFFPHILEDKKRETDIGYTTERLSSEIKYMPHQLVAVWSPHGWAKSFTAFNLASVAVALGFDTALINYDLQCPELDTYFGIKQTGLVNDPPGKGLMTLGGDEFHPVLATRLMQKIGGINYLAAGNKMVNIGTPDIEPEKLEQVLRNIYSRGTGGKPAITIVDAGRCYEYAPTLAAIRLATVVIVPTDGTPLSAETTKQQIEELNRIGYNPRFIELCFEVPGRRKLFRVCDEHITVLFDWPTFINDCDNKRPQCSRLDGRRVWECVLHNLFPPPPGNFMRRLTRRR